MAGEGGGYPGLPNWGYGLHLQPNDLLQFIKGTPAWKEVQQRQGLSDAQIAHLAAQTGLAGVQTQGAQQDITQKAELFPLQKEHTQSQIGTERAKLGSEVLGQAKTRQEMDFFPQTAQALIGERGAMGDYYKAHAQQLKDMPDDKLFQAALQLYPHLQPTRSIVNGPDGKPTIVETPHPMAAILDQLMAKKFGGTLTPMLAKGGATAHDPNAVSWLKGQVQNKGNDQSTSGEATMWNQLPSTLLESPVVKALYPSLALALGGGDTRLVKPQAATPQPATSAPQAAPAPKAQPKSEAAPARTPAQMTPAELQERYQLSPLMRYLDRLLYAGGLANKLPSDAAR